jgi:rubrerythrin
VGRYRAFVTEIRADTAEAREPGPQDLSTMCWQCGTPMREEHAHYRCPACGWRDSCCDGPY